MTVIPLSGDASTRRYYRLARRRGDLRRWPSTRSRSTPDELPFVVVRDLHGGLGPARARDRGRRRGARASCSSRTWATSRCRRRCAAPERARATELYRQALDQLVGRSSARRRAAPQRADCFQIAFDFEKLSWELHFFRKHFLEGYRRRDLSVEDRAVLADGFHRLCCGDRLLAARPVPPRLPQPQPDVPRRRALLDRLPGRAHGPGHATTSPRCCATPTWSCDEEFVADRAEEFRQRAVPGEARDAFLRRFELMSRPAQPEGAGHLRLHGAPCAADRVYLPYIPRTLEHLRRNLAALPGAGRPAPGAGPPPRGAAVTPVARIADFRGHVGEEVASRAGCTTSAPAASCSS